MTQNNSNEFINSIIDSYVNKGYADRLDDNSMVSLNDDTVILLENDDSLLKIYHNNDFVSSYDYNDNLFAEKVNVRLLYELNV